MLIQQTRPQLLTRSAVSFFLSVTVFYGCNSREVSHKGAFAEITVSRADHKEISGSAGIAEDGVEMFPQLRLYDNTGRLSSVIHDSAKSVEVLNSTNLPNRFAHVIPNTPNLNALAQAVARVDHAFPAAAFSHGPTIVSVLLEECKGCVIQEKAMIVDREKLNAEGINVLVVQFC